MTELYPLFQESDTIDRACVASGSARHIKDTGYLEEAYQFGKKL